MYRIAVLAERDEKRKGCAEQIARFCRQKGLFLQLEGYSNQEPFFEDVQKAAPTNAVIVLPGVVGLNAVEHLRSLCPGCGIIWCSDLDFSLQAFRLRVEYFLLEPVSVESFQQGLNIWFANKDFHSNESGGNDRRRT